MLCFKDEAETVNKLVPELKKKGVEDTVVLIHEGGVDRDAFEAYMNPFSPVAPGPQIASRKNHKSA